MAVEKCNLLALQQEKSGKTLRGQWSSSVNVTHILYTGDLTIAALKQKTKRFEIWTVYSVTVFWYLLHP